MNPLSTITGASRRVRAAMAAAAILVAGAIVLVLLQPGSGNATTPATTATSSSRPAPATAAQKAQLHAALRAARALHGQARVAALKKVRANAEAGQYGARIERRVERRTTRREALISVLPKSLQDQIAKIHQAPAAQRRALRQQLRSDALAGDYGSTVQQYFEKLRSLRGRSGSQIS